MKEVKYPSLEQVPATDYVEAYDFDRARDASLQVFELLPDEECFSLHSLRVIARDIEHKDAITEHQLPVNHAHFGFAALYLIETGHLQRGEDKLIRKSTPDELEESRRTREAARHLRTLMEDNQVI